MTDLQILEQLLNGNHLSKSKLERASNLLVRLAMEVKSRENPTYRD